MPSCPYQNRERSCWCQPVSLVRSSVVDIRSRRARSFNHLRGTVDRVRERCAGTFSRSVACSESIGPVIASAGSTRHRPFLASPCRQLREGGAAFFQHPTARLERPTACLQVADLLTQIAEFGEIFPLIRFTQTEFGWSESEFQNRHITSQSLPLFVSLPLAVAACTVALLFLSPVSAAFFASLWLHQSAIFEELRVANRDQKLVAAVQTYFFCCVAVVESHR